jgi:hypothetical protein
MASRRNGVTGFDEAASAIENTANQFGKAARPDCFVKALSTIEENMAFSSLGLRVFTSNLHTCWTA